MKHIGRYTHLHFEVSSLSYILLGKMRCRTGQWITETREMKETLVKDRGYRPELLSEHNSLISNCREFIYGVLDDKKKPFSIVVEGIGEIEVESLRKYSRDILSRAFCVKMKEIERWKTYTRIYVEAMASHLKLSIANLVDTYMDADMLDMQMLKEPEYGLGLKEMLEKYPLEREDLKDRIEKLKNAKEICDGIVNAFNL
jgi:interferon-induced GTP-binding protein Mx1